MWEVKQNFLSRNDEELIRKCFQASCLPTSPTITVSGLGRYGKSGARLLECLLNKKRVFVVKIHERKKIHREFRAMNSVRDYFPGVEFLGKPASVSKHSALLYRHQGERSKQKIGSYTELCDIAYDLGTQDEEIRRVFRGIWQCCETARKWEGVEKIRTLNLKDQYEHYTRRTEAEKVLSSIFGANRDKDRFSFLEAEIANPLIFLGNACFELPQRGRRGPVHGDLHANNVVIDNFKKVHLIDFAWADAQKHVLVDYVLMECSLRFLLFPHYVNPSEQLRVDECLLNADGPEELERWATGSPLEGKYRRLGIMLNEVRGEARKFLAADNNNGFLEYLAAQFLVLFGQMSYPDYNRFIGARALGLIAHKLQEANFGQSPPRAIPGTVS
jgi:hypothetical protein